MGGCAISQLKVLDNCPDELNEVIRKIEEATEGQVVGKIGNVITLYRPSLRKLSSVQKKKRVNPIQFVCVPINESFNLYILPYS